MSFIVIDYFGEIPNILGEDGTGKPEYLDTLDEAREFMDYSAQNGRIVNTDIPEAIFGEGDLKELLFKALNEFSEEELGMTEDDVTEKVDVLYNEFMLTTFKKRYE